MWLVQLALSLALLLNTDLSSGQFLRIGQPRYFQSQQIQYNGPPPNAYQSQGPPGQFPPFEGPGQFPRPPGGFRPQVLRGRGLGPLPLGREIVQPLVFEYANLAPDSYVQQGITVNGQFPGSAIRVKMYDILHVELTNRLDHGISLHFHGIRNYGEPDSEGVPHVTQELIPPGGIYHYRINIGFQTGTFMYHLHNGLDSIWAVGPLIIEDGTELLANHEEYFHFWDYTFILQQCYHTPLDKMLEGLENSPFKGLPEVESILINGQSHGSWNESNAADSIAKGFEVVSVKAGKTYRFRVIGFGTDSILSFKIQGHTMRIIEVDGIITKPVTVDHLQVNSGQRYSVLVKMDQAEGNYLIESEMIPGPGPKNGRAILQYEGAADPGPMRKEVLQGKTPKVNPTPWETSKLAPNPVIRQPDIYSPPTTFDKEIIIKAQRKNESDGGVKYEVNGQLFKDPKVSYLAQVRSGVNITKEPQVFESLTNKSVQIVFQNVPNGDGLCEQRSWHLHGHSFYVVGQGPGEYDRDKDGKEIERRVKEEPETLVFRDVVTLYPDINSPEVKVNSSSKVKRDVSSASSIAELLNNSSTIKPPIQIQNSTDKSSPNSEPDVKNGAKETSSFGGPCGWLAIRFVTDNPGLWLAHSHLTAHLIMGEEFVVYAHQESNPLFTG